MQSLENSFLDFRFDLIAFEEKLISIQHMPLKMYQSLEIAFVTYFSESILDTTVLENYDFTYFHATK